MIYRQLTNKIKEYSKSYPVVALIGPRQSGKTTLLKNIFSKIYYVSLEDLDARLFAEKDPRGFLDTYKAPVIFDEIQKAPKLFSYIQTAVDKTNKAGQYILSGSQNFNLVEKITQSLAGRVGILTLLPLSVDEINKKKLSINNVNSAIFSGFYPRIWDKKINSSDWYSNYIQTYIERDVRQIKNISDLSLFQKFVKLCAGRSGQILNMSLLGADCGVNHNTIRSWLSILETSYIIYFLNPYYKNFNKRLIKSSKIYFYDTGLMCSLLGIENENQIITHPLRGALFETFIVGEFVKKYFNQGKKFSGFYISEKNGHEVDLFFEKNDEFMAIEIKSGATFSDNYFDNIKYWQKNIDLKPQNSYVIYGGIENQKRTIAQVLSWKNSLQTTHSQ